MVNLDENAELLCCSKEKVMELNKQKEYNIEEFKMYSMQYKNLKSMLRNKQEQVNIIQSEIESYSN